MSKLKIFDTKTIFLIIFVMLITNCGNSWIRDEYKDELVNAAVVWAGESNRSYIENDVEDFCEDIHSDLNELLDFEYSSPFDVKILYSSAYMKAQD